jgi:hypothetical protein
VSTENKWICITDQLPPDDYVLLLFSSGVVCQGRQRYGNLGEPSQDKYEYRASCCGRFGGVTHWMPIPKL